MKLRILYRIKGNPILIKIEVFHNKGKDRDLKMKETLPIY